jgi:hypothetical protein
MSNLDTDYPVKATETVPKREQVGSRKKSILKRAGGGMLAAVGFILSPISWWNDLLINIPLAYLFAGAITWARPDWFNAAFVIGYLLTNVLGLILMQYGMKHAARSEKSFDFRKELRSSLVWSVAYSILIVVLLLIGWIKPPLEYLK